MPTGYTAPVGEGKITELSDFVMQCARAFGALITMRDDPMDASVPKEFKPNSYHYDRLIECQKELEDLLRHQNDQQWIDDYNSKNHRDSLKRYDERIAERKITYNRYKSMLKQVQEWEPPTNDHTGLKTFMIQQLNDTIKCDCYEIYQPVFKNYFQDQIEYLNEDIEYHKELYNEEINSTENTNAWVKALRESLTKGDNNV